MEIDYSTYPTFRVEQQIPYDKFGHIDYNQLNDWFTPNQCVYEDTAIRILEFKKGDGTPILIMPPQTGHSGKIVDYDKGKSLVECAMKNSNRGVYVLEWKSCTKERRDEDYYSLIEQINTAVDFLGGEVSLHGMCQAGTAGLVYTTFYPSKVKTLSIAGAPLDVNQEGILYPAICKPMWFYESTISMFGGLMPGLILLECFKMGDLTQHYVTRFQTKNDYRKARFEAWYYHNESLQDIAGGWYLEVVEKLFKKNQLVKGEMMLRGELVDLRNVKCPVNIVVGTKDDISPKSHSWNIDKYLLNCQGVTKYETHGGHIGIYCGSTAVNSVWSDIFSKL